MNSKSLAILSGLTSALVFVLMGYFVKIYGEGHTTAEIAAARALFVMAVLLPFTFKSLTKPKTFLNLTLWMRCIFGGVGILILMWLLKVTSLTIARSLYFLIPAFTALLGVFLLNEKLKSLQVLGAIITVLFAMLPTLLPQILSHELTHTLHSKILIIGTLGGLTAALAQISLRKTVTGTINASTIVFMLCFVNLIFCLVYQPNVLSKVLHWEYWPLYLSVGLTGLIAQLTLTWSYIPLSAAVASYLSLSSFIWTLLLDYFMFHKNPTLLECGSVVGVIFGIYLLQRKT